MLWSVPMLKAYVLANDEIVKQSSEMLTSTEFLDMIGSLASLGDDTIIIYDLPPVLMADDFLAFSSYADCVLFVVAQGETRREDFGAAGEVLEDSDVLGIILNKSTDVIDTYY